ncbi:MAG: alpha/beta-hydrolase family protein, partial [Pseudonocardiaceae bacterium]
MRDRALSLAGTARSGPRRADRGGRCGPRGADRDAEPARGAAEIERVTGRPALEPVRAYVGLRSVCSTEQQVQLAVAELEKDGALARSTILVVVPTGSGWVDPAAVAALEYLSAGNLATVAVQYAERPSWLEYVLGRGQAASSASALLSALRQRLDRIPAPHRPQLLVYGESLGAIGARSATTLAD